MNNVSDVLGDLLPAALGVAISPVLATVLMLLSRRARKTAPAFALGWMLGLTLVLALVLVLSDRAGVSEPSSSTSTYWVKLGLGLLFLLLAANSWRNRPRQGYTPKAPAWMAKLETISPGVALGLGAALSAANPKNLALTVSGAVTMAAGDLSSAQTALSVLIFVVVASALVVGPVIAFLINDQKMAKPLDALKNYMELHNAAIMTVLLSVLGVANLGRGLGGLLA